MLRTLWAVGIALSLAGCLDPILPFPAAGGASGWSSVVEPSMAPDFTGDGETYPILLVHQHHVLSERQREESSRVVCQTTDGEEIELLRPRVEAKACAGPAVDAATGRLFLERAAFDAEDPDAVLAMTRSCSGGAVLFDEARRELVVQTPAHGFLVQLHANRSFSVDDRWIEPGTALKVEYYIDRGSAKDEQYVRVVFDHPGEWLVSRVAPWDAETDGGLPRPPEQGTGLEADVPLSAATLLDVLDATLRATPGAVERVEALRVVHDGERLTEATVRYGTAQGTVTWYGSGRTGESLHLLGAEASPSGSPGAPLAAVQSAFDLGWAELRAGVPGALTDVRLDPAVAWRGPAGTALALDPALHPGGCAGGCVLVHGPGPLEGSTWRVLLAPEQEPSEGATTLQVLAFGDDGGAPAEVWWHAPEA